jgi:hypothetical protein
MYLPIAHAMSYKLSFKWNFINKLVLISYFEIYRKNCNAKFHFTFEIHYEHEYKPNNTMLRFVITTTSFLYLNSYTNVEHNQNSIAIFLFQKFK